ncbi:nascent polypeptide-associated complex protein [Thermogladius sp. KZ2Tp1]|uniref:nascent polypeptide-associated complex protein n=1 Tax=unclassified Thermogladius TaxID=2647734 RepID=UPI003D0E3681
MIPGFSPRELKRALKRMGLDVEELSGVEKVEFYLKDRRIVIESPQVVVIKSKNQTVFQVVGEAKEETTGKEQREAVVAVNEEDVEFVASQAGVSKEEARRALMETKGDIAEAILRLKERRGSSEVQ